MILSYRHRFTFLHAPKTAGSSVKVVFAPHLGPRDIILGARPERRAERIRPNLRAWFDAVSTLDAPGLAAAVARVSPKRVLNLQEKAYGRHFGVEVDHPSAAQLRAFDPKAWERNFKFSFVRNPYERTVSLYFFVTGTEAGERPSFAAFLHDLQEGRGRLRRYRHLLDQWSIYAIGDRIAVDFIGRHECFDTDFEAIRREINIPVAAPPRAKASPRYDFRDLYGEATRKLVGRLCEREIDHFGYRFSA